MTENSPIYQLSDLELKILSAYFLALPLPPLLSGETPTDQDQAQAALKGAAQSLYEKGYITSPKPDGGKDLVLPALADCLRAMAYGNQMTHLYLQEKGKAPSQLAFYHYQDQFVQQELMEDAVHLIQKAEDLGETLVLNMLSTASESERGANTHIPLDLWHLLLTSRVYGTESAVLDELASKEQQPGHEVGDHRLNLIRDILQAQSILEITSVMDRLKHQQEKSVFILGEGFNWLAMVTPLMWGEAGQLFALQVPPHNLMLASGGIFTALNAVLSNQGRSA